MESIKFLSTADFAENLGVKPDTLRRALCMGGHYLGVRPLKLKNGRLLWPETDPRQLAQ